MEKNQITITDIYRKFAFEWAFPNDIVKWQAPAHLLLGETSLYESGDHLFNRLTRDNMQKRLSKIYEAATNRKPYAVTYEMQVQKDKVATIEEQGRVFFSPDGQMVLCRGYICSKNVREQKLHEYFSNSDAISYLKEILDKTEAEDLHASFVYLCIDRLPVLAVKYGVEKITTLMEKVRNVLDLSTREYDRLGQISGTSYGIVLQNCGHNEIVVVAKRLTDALEKEKFEIDGDEIHLSASIGGCIIQQSDSATVEKILNHSERALLDAQHIKKIAIPTKYLPDKLDGKSAKQKTRRRAEDQVEGEAPEKETTKKTKQTKKVKK